LSESTSKKTTVLLLARVGRKFPTIEVECVETTSVGSAIDGGRYFFITVVAKYPVPTTQILIPTIDVRYGFIRISKYILMPNI
jgi:hypothetical protein